ncbi:MAG: hypothetical protein ACI4RR_05490 [Eubacterium sp.]
MINKIIKKITLIILCIVLVISTVPMESFANDESDYYAQYSGSTSASWGYNPNCTFTINRIVGNRFRGTFSAQNIDPYSFTENVSGLVTSNAEKFTCYFRVSFYNGRYYSNIVATVYPYEGRCECLCEGSWHLVDFEMDGTKFIKSIDPNEAIGNSNYCENDMILSTKLSNYIYMMKNNSSNRFIELVKEEEKDLFDKNSIEESSIKVYNFKRFGNDDHNADNVAFAIMLRKTDENSVDVFVVIRGTYKDEWQGNTEITGTSYDNSIAFHDNFKKASDSIKPIIKKYVKKYCLDYDNINLIITGHSRGAAVANLYAKEATDSINGVYDGSIPSFSSVTAYTFATPNVEKYNASMESYNNIYNFCFAEDVVPTVPLTKPISGWGYWKYGKTFIANLDNPDLKAKILTDDFYIVNNVPKIHDCLWKWSSVNDYYNKQLYAKDSFEDYTTLYEFAHSATGLMGSVNKKFHGVYNLLKNYKKYVDIYPIMGTAIPIMSSIGNAHHYDTYLTVISNTGDDHFKLTTFDKISSSVYSSDNNQKIYTEQIQNLNANTENISNLTSFANQGDNLSILGWNLDDPLTWEGITWNADGNVESIDLSFKNLSGELDLSGFSSLKSLDLSGNEITGVTLTNCSSLEEIDCSFNKLNSLDLSDCTSLTSVTCCYNYLDTHEGGTLYNTLDDLMFNDCYVNYYPQAVPENATFNTTELNALKTFANTDNNESVLDWLDDDGNIDTEKLQNNILFEYDGSNYRVVAIDVSESDVSGTLNLTSLSLLQEVYCENTKITSLNVNGCTKLETLQCDGCNITTLTLPSNAADKNTPLYDVSCEYNYIDTSIFAPTIVEYVNFKAGANLEYENQKGDSSALQAALSFANELEEKDYSASTYETLKELLDECNYYNFDNLYLTQSDIDNLTTEILTAMYELKAYFNVNISAPNGSFTIAYDDELFTDTAKHSLLYGTTVTLNATPNEGYSFVGWYDTVNNIYMSKNTQYTFRVSSNSKLKAVFVPEGSATLTFANYSNWIAGTVTKTTQEWAELSTIADLLPDVPYRYGYSNGRWVYNESDVLERLQAGEDVTIGAEYDDDNTSFPTPRVATDKPVLDLYYKYDSENTLGSFVMASGFPENIQVESVGIAFYYKDANVFDPTDNFTLLLNNKMLVGRFNIDVLEDIYIVNMKNMTSAYNWAARGFVTYYDENENLVTEYSNQINIIDTKNADEIPFEEAILPDENFN